MPAEGWRAHIGRNLAATGRGISGGAIDTMLVAHEAQVLASARPTILSDIATGARQAASSTLAAVLEAELDAAGSRGRAVLGRIATGQPIYAHQASGASIQKTVRALVADGWTRRVGRGDDMITEPMLAHHLRAR